jgi:hypothetical protein
MTYFNAVLTLLNSVLRLVPTPLTAVMIAIAIPAAIRPYSIAVAPDSSDQNFTKKRFTLILQILCWLQSRPRKYTRPSKVV